MSVTQATLSEPQSGHSDALTEGIRVRVGAQFLEDQSRPEIGRWYFAYRVILRNEGEGRARLLTRHWTIKDADNRVRRVDGPGVVGEHPDLAPGESFEYMSGCPLETPWGTMEGSYTFKNEDGDDIEALIGRFFLAPNVAPFSSL